MKKVACLFGIAIIFFDSLGWVASSPADFYRLSSAEFAMIFLVGVLLMLPELVFQFREFFSSGAGDDAPF